MKSLEDFAQLLAIKRYSRNTIKNYRHAVERFLMQASIAEEKISLSVRAGSNKRDFFFYPKTDRGSDQIILQGIVW